MPKYISLMSDFGFKRVFANPDYPHILISFIESVLPELSIESIEHIDTTQFADYVDDRTSIFDVFCRLCTMVPLSLWKCNRSGKSITLIEQSYTAVTSFRDSLKRENGITNCPESTSSP